VIESLKRRLGKIIELHFERHRKAEIERSLQEVIAAHGGDVLTKEIVNDFAELLANRVLRIERDLGTI